MTYWLDAMGGSLNYSNAGGIRTRCFEAGDGEAIIMLHGVGGHVENFIKNVVRLSESYHPIAVDMLGHGLTDKPDVAYEIPDYVDHLLALLDAKGIKRAHFLGLSLGGWVAFWLCKQHPDRALSYTCLTGAGIQIDESFDPMGNPGVTDLKKRSAKAATTPTYDSVKQRLEWLFHKPDEFVSDELIQTRLHIYSRPQMVETLPKIMSFIDPALAKKWYITPQALKEFSVPAFFLWTEHNPTTPWQVGKAASELVVGAKFDVMKNCGHWPQYEDPEGFAERVTKFLAGVSAK